MASDRAGKAGLFIGVLDAIGIAVLAARKVAQAAPGTVIQLPKEVMDLIITMAEGVGAILAKLDDVITAIKAIPGGGGGVGYPPNADTITSIFVGCPAVQPTAYQLPNIAVPDTMEVQLLARNPAGANVGIIYVAGTQAAAGTTGQARPLIPGATIGYKVKNANRIFIGATVPGEGVYLTVEQRTT